MAKSLLLVLLLVFSTFAHSQKLEDLEAVISKAKSLDDFLGRPDLVEEYYLSLSHYYGADKFPRKSFDAILNQLRQIITKVPELKIRLWQSISSGESFQITTSVKSSGRDIDVKKWQTLLAEKENEFRNQALDLIEASDLKDENAVNEMVKRIDEKVKDFLSSKEYVAASAKNKRVMEASFYKIIKELNEYKKVVSYYSYKLFKSERFIDMVSSGDADLTFESLNEMKLSTANMLEESKLPSLVISGIREKIPSSGEMLKNNSIFPVRMMQTQRGLLVPEGSGSTLYEFKKIPRRIHGIWKGVVLGECVGGNCHSLESLTPERWATVAIKDSQLHFVEKGSSYVGFVESIPGRIGDETFASVGFGAPDLRKKILIEDPVSKKIIKSSLFSEWKKEAKKQIPKEWIGFVVSNSDDINNASVLPLVRASPEYVFGEDVGKLSGEFKTIDPLVSEIIEHSPREGYAKTYGGNMVFDAVTPNAKNRGSQVLLGDVSFEESISQDFFEKEFSSKNNNKTAQYANYLIANKITPTDSMKKIALNTLGLMKSSNYLSDAAKVNELIYEKEYKELFKNPLNLSTEESLQRIFLLEKQNVHFDPFLYLSYSDQISDLDYSPFIDDYISSRVVKEGLKFQEGPNFWPLIERSKKSKEHILDLIKNDNSIALSSKKFWNFIDSSSYSDENVWNSLKSKILKDPLKWMDENFLEYLMIKWARKININTDKDLRIKMFEILGDEVIPIQKRIDFLERIAPFTKEESWKAFIKGNDLSEAAYKAFDKMLESVPLNEANVNKILKSGSSFLRTENVKVYDFYHTNSWNSKKNIHVPEKLKTYLLNKNSQYDTGALLKFTGYEWISFENSKDSRNMMNSFVDKDYESLFNKAKTDVSTREILLSLVDIFKPTDSKFKSEYVKIVSSQYALGSEISEGIVRRLLPIDKYNIQTLLEYVKFKPFDQSITNLVIEHINLNYNNYAPSEKKIAQDIFANLLSYEYENGVRIRQIMRNHDELSRMSRLPSSIRKVNCLKNKLFQLMQ